MNYEDIWRFLNLGIDVDWNTKRITLRAGPVTVENLPLGTAKALSGNPLRVQLILGEHFIQRAVMWADYRREQVDHCVRSLRQLQELSSTKAEEFGCTGSSADAVFATALFAWANACDEAAGVLEWALEEQGDPINTGMDTSARDFIPEALRGLRRQTIPIVTMFAELLPKDDLVRKQAEEKLRAAQDSLIRCYHGSFGDVAAPEWDVGPA